MASDWQQARLGDFIEVAHGWPFKGDCFCAPSDGLPVVVKPGNFLPSGGLNFEYGRTQGYRGSYPPEYELRPGDFLVVMTCQTHGGEILGAPGVVPDGNVRYLHNQRLGKVLIREGAPIDKRFLYWLLADWDVRSQLFASASGSTVLHTSPSRIEQAAIRLPPVPEQRRIASVLDALDDKIESNRRLAATLEETAAALFRTRFVDFVGVADFDDSEIGQIPSGWTVAPVGDVLKIVGGGTPSTKEPTYWEGGTHCWATPKDLAGGTSLTLIDTARHITDEGVRSISSGLLPRRTVLLSSRAPVGYTAISMVDIAINQGFIAIPPDDRLPSEYVLFWLRKTMDLIEAHAGGTTFAEISKRAFRPLPMLIPSPQALAEFREIAPALVDLIASAEHETQTLAEVRDALLPKLVSGAIRVPGTTDSDEVTEPATGELVAGSP